MKKTKGFKARPSTHRWSVAPTGRARCRVCKERVAKGALRLETCAFVMPGRVTVLMTHALCVTGKQVADVMRVYKSVSKVPLGDGVCPVEMNEALSRMDRLREDK